MLNAMPVFELLSRTGELHKTWADARAPRPYLNSKRTSALARH